MLKLPFIDISVLTCAAEHGRTVERLILASCVEELHDLDAAQAGTVIFFTDWLGWVEWRQKGGRAVHLESFLTSWPQELGEQDSFQQRATAWMYQNGLDVTLFQGVSLGKQFNWEVAGVRLAAGRLFAALTRAFSSLKPLSVEYRGLRSEYGFLAKDTLLDLARSAACALSLPFADHTAALHKERLDPELSFDREFQPQPWHRKAMLCLAEQSIDFVSRLAGLLRHRVPRVFVLHNLLVVKSLIEHLPRGRVTPLLFARMHPKRPSFLFAAWRKGVRLLALPAVSLTTSDKLRLDEIRTRIEFICAGECRDPSERAMRHFLKRCVLIPGVLEAKAVEILQICRLLEDEKPRRILVGDSENHMCRLFCEVAQSLGIGVDELPNGMFLTGQRMDNRSGDGFRGPVIDRLLAWGKPNLGWAKLSQVAAPAIETGYPVADCLALNPAPAATGAGRALILPLHVDKTDLTGLFSEVFVNLIRAVHAAKDAGYRDIRIKVHPGFVHLDYYQEVARRFGLDAVIFKDGPLLPHIAWSDIVIGPVNSGAMIETVALGRPYYSVLNPPSAIEPVLASPAKPLLPADLPGALNLGRAEDRGALLSGIAGQMTGQPAGRRVWNAILIAIAERPCPTCA